MDYRFSTIFKKGIKMYFTVNMLGAVGDEACFAADLEESIAETESETFSDHCSMDEGDSSCCDDCCSYSCSEDDESSSSSDWNEDLETWMTKFLSKPVPKSTSMPIISKAHNLGPKPDYLVPSPIQNDMEFNHPVVALRMQKCESAAFQSPNFLESTSKTTPPDHGKGNDSNSGSANPSPVEYLTSLLREQGLTIQCLAPSKESFLAITEEHIAAYSMQAAMAARKEDLVTIRQLFEAGHSLQGCNRYGESLVHIVCRRGSFPLLKFLLKEAKVNIRIHDDFGRTPLHDAAWTEKPDFELVKLILDEAPNLLFAVDKRGHTALSYVPRQQWGVWRAFLKENLGFYLTEC